MPGRSKGCAKGMLLRFLDPFFFSPQNIGNIFLKFFVVVVT